MTTFHALVAHSLFALEPSSQGDSRGRVCIDFLESGSTVGTGSRQKVEYSVLLLNQRDNIFSTLRLLISQPPSGSDSSEGALRRLLASRAVVVCTTTSADLCSDLRARCFARPQDAPKALAFSSLFSSSATLLLGPAQFVSYFLLVRLLTLKLDGSAGRLVEPKIQHSQRHFFGFIRDLEIASSVKCCEGCGTRRSFVRRQEGPCTEVHFFGPFSGPLLTGEGFCHVEFRGALEDAKIGLLVPPESRARSNQIRIIGWRQLYFVPPLVFV